MRSPLRTAAIAWCVAVASAVGGVVAATSSDLLALVLFALAGALGASVGAALVVAGLGQSRRRRAARKALIALPLSRLEYVPSVTSRVPRLRWHGSRYWSIGRGGRPGQPEEPATLELVGSPDVSARRTAAAVAAQRAEGAPRLRMEWRSSMITPPPATDSAVSSAETDRSDGF